jgi:molybdopterin/thiamine biosynthesis adenylyltransferase
MDLQGQDRYQRNMNTLSPEENRRLADFSVCVVGCGGLGGYIIEMLGRLGIGSIVAVDGDVFEPTNLNRQLLSLEGNLGQPKALAARDRMAAVNSSVAVRPVTERFTAENGAEILAGCHLAFDALDNAASRRVLEEACENAGIPLVHGAIGGWYGQVCVVFPGDRILSELLPEGTEKGIEAELGNPAFTPALVAAMEVSEGIKVLFDRPGILRRRLLAIDLLNHEYEVLDL